MFSLIVVDGDSLLCRAYYTPGYKHLTHNSQPDGLPTGALFGFMRMITDLIKTYNPTHLAVAFDVRRTNFRNQYYPEYKAQRDSTPDDLIPQKQYVRICLSAFGIYWVDFDGYEADDLVATIVRHASGYSFDSIKVVTGDHDLIQLVNDQIQVLYTYKGVSDIVTYRSDNTKQLYGVHPNQVPDLKALWGDNSDNIPGCPGIGEKTARQLLAEYGSLEGILDNIDKLKGKKKENLIANEINLRTYKFITQVYSGVPLQIDYSRMDVRTLNRIQGLDKLREFGIVNIAV